MNGKNRSQGKGLKYFMAISMAALLIAGAKSVYDYRQGPLKGVREDPRTARYLAEHSGPFCAFEGVCHNWDSDETIALGCLKVKGNIREGSYSSEMGPRATSNFRVSGTYDLDFDSSMQVAGNDRNGKRVHFTTPIYVEDTEYPSHMILINKKGESGFYIWKRKE